MSYGWFVSIDSRPDGLSYRCMKCPSWYWLLLLIFSGTSVTYAGIAARAALPLHRHSAPLALFAHDRLTRGRAVGAEAIRALVLPPALVVYADTSGGVRAAFGWSRGDGLADDPGQGFCGINNFIELRTICVILKSRPLSRVMFEVIYRRLEMTQESSWVIFSTTLCLKSLSENFFWLTSYPWSQTTFEVISERLEMTQESSKLFFSLASRAIFRRFQMT